MPIDPCVCHKLYYIDRDLVPATTMRHFIVVLRYCAWRHYGIRFSTTGTKDQPQMYRQSHVANSCKTMRIPSIKIIIFIKNLFLCAMKLFLIVKIFWKIFLKKI